MLSQMAPFFAHQSLGELRRALAVLGTSPLLYVEDIHRAWPLARVAEWHADFQSAGLHDHGSGRATAGNHAGLDDGGAGGGFRVGLEFENFGLEGHEIEQVVHALAGEGGNFGEFRVATDIPDYVRQTRTEVPKAGFALVAEGAEPWADWYSTRYEQKALREGRVPHYLTFRRR